MDVLTSRDMDNLFGFHPFIRKALRTDRIPESEEIARALGEEPATIACLREHLESESHGPDTEAPEPTLMMMKRDSGRGTATS
jgi:hypothetical protein